MEAHQERVLTEKEELDVKISGLDSFVVHTVFPGVDIVEQHRLKRQLRIMKEYSEILGERIAAF